MTNFEFFDALSGEISRKDTNLSFFRTLHGYNAAPPETEAEIEELNIRLQALLKAMGSGIINPEDEYSPLIPIVIPTNNQ